MARSAGVVEGQINKTKVKCGSGFLIAIDRCSNHRGVVPGKEINNFLVTTSS